MSHVLTPNWAQGIMLITLTAQHSGAQPGSCLDVTVTPNQFNYKIAADTIRKYHRIVQPSCPNACWRSKNKAVVSLLVQLHTIHAP